MGFKTVGCPSCVPMLDSVDLAIGIYWRSRFSASFYDGRDKDDIRNRKSRGVGKKKANSSKTDSDLVV